MNTANTTTKKAMKPPAQRVSTLTALLAASLLALAAPAQTQTTTSETRTTRVDYDAYGQVLRASTLTANLGGSSTAVLTSSTVLAFGAVTVGTASPSQAWTFRNDGNGPLSLALGALNALFSLLGNTCTNVLYGGTCALGVQMAPPRRAPTARAASPSAEPVRATAATSASAEASSRRPRSAQLPRRWPSGPSTRG